MHNKTEISKMAASRFLELTDKEISEIKINSVPKNTKEYKSKIQKTYAKIPRLRLGEYLAIIWRRRSDCR
jgi:hypothetical protein